MPPSPARSVRLGATPCGRGVFALLPFEPRQIVAVIHGAVVHDPAYESDYCMAISGDACLEPTSPFCYLNHSCDPNCDWFERRPSADDAVPDAHILLRAIKPILPGDELTIDYAWPAAAAIPCLCQSPNCRGWIVAADELAELLQAS